MSRSLKRNSFAAFDAAVNGGGGRVPVIRNSPDKDVSHSKECFMCGKGKRPRRQVNKAARRAAKRMLTTGE